MKDLQLHASAVKGSRLALMLVLTASVLVGHAPAAIAETGVEEHRIEFHTTAICAYTCPYVVWIVLGLREMAGAAACKTQPDAIPGSYDDKRVLAPAMAGGQRTAYLRFGIQPKYWSDGVVCRVVAAGTPSESYEFVHFNENTPLSVHRRHR